ncbi:putative hydrolase,Predicted metal-dependent RNase, consists of a metallo-beta-lactamase domain and an RNA-binding KH domain,ribonuclease Z,Metallo-beta-lactamase superfamily [Chlamydia serpentis]|uniref:Putative hydrolase,Predicted metal-dependent RNase, consists of a metallo-beta-lactamase domain and an RNA-binding KH domain,ribonuclease Z,Metallo-beta-lactamase superfamily n=1 Tax=Chlamydia serpentis TaxID=1967782 RepID=A0A2R8FBA5_9CHLA|nr:MBL fold metallo-hydrolase [Chlamydia serpentis]SPN73602.1 putative hydrolase,Predicted metal-dependent RNase, consists of a metallo-beta-lactamase domain and an RNA-binding KH domain,ribonuclease Z,Metallo-beta-lactamase superfamily [Chlamydia serpentis]
MAHDIQEDSLGKLIFLGTGNPEGIPVAFCSCRICQENKIHRLRASVLIQYRKKNFLIDTGPDFRTQMLAAGVSELSGVFLTHFHYDHIGGIDDLRAWYIVTQRSLPIVLSANTYKLLEKTKDYLLTPHNTNSSLPAVLEFKILNEEYGEDEFEGIPYTYISYYQRSCHVTGFRFGNLVYLTDLHSYDPKIFSYLDNVDTLIVSAGPSEIPLAFQGYKTSHLTVEEVRDFADHAGVSNLIITHISHCLEAERHQHEQVTFAYDGMEVLWKI